MKPYSSLTTSNEINSAIPVISDLIKKINFKTTITPTKVTLQTKIKNLETARQSLRIIHQRRDLIKRNPQEGETYSINLGPY